jgi:hypothetical protein
MPSSLCSTRIHLHQLYRIKLHCLFANPLRVCEISDSHATSMKMTSVVAYVEPYSLVEIDLRFRGAYCLHNQSESGGL